MSLLANRSCDYKTETRRVMALQMKHSTIYTGSWLRSLPIPMTFRIPRGALKALSWTPVAIFFYQNCYTIKQVAGRSMQVRRFHFTSQGLGTVIDTSQLAHAES